MIEPFSVDTLFEMLWEDNKCHSKLKGIILLYILLLIPYNIYNWMNEWMNEWSIYIALYCVLLYTQSALQSYEGVSLQPPPVCSIHLDDATAATGQWRQCAHHTPATGGEEREIEPIKWMKIIGRPWLTRASGGNLARTPGLHPYSLRWVSWDFKWPQRVKTSV